MHLHHGVGVWEGGGCGLWAVGCVYYWAGFLCVKGRRLDGGNIYRIVFSVWWFTKRSALQASRNGAKCISGFRWRIKPLLR